MSPKIEYRGRFTTALLMTAVLTGNAAVCLAQEPATTAKASAAAQPDLRAEFASRDRNADGWLSEDEFVVPGKREAAVLLRDFKVFDFDDDGRLSVAEFVALPYLEPKEQRGAIRDPLVVLVDARWKEMDARWSKWDRDGDGVLALDEFSTAAVGRSIPGLEMTGFKDWDLDRDRKISREEVRGFLEIAYGIRLPTGGMLRLKDGNVVDWQFFRRLDPDGDGTVSKDEYFRAQAGVNDIEGWYRTIDKNNDGKFDYTEFTGSNHRTVPVDSFLHCDKDLNGRLTLEEFEGLSDGQRRLTKYCFPGFDDDGDGALSLSEYLMTPLPTHAVLASWEAARDEDHDGKLSLAEFHFVPGPMLAALTAEYFRRLDTNKDGFLSLTEFVFVIDPARVPRDVVMQLRDRDGDGRLSFDEVLGDVKRPQPGDRVDVGQEAALVRTEEAFRRADANGDRTLDLRELATDDGLEAISPGAAALSKKASKLSLPAAKFLGMDEANVQMYAIVGFNVLLFLAAAIYLFRGKRERTS